MSKYKTVGDLIDAIEVLDLNTSPMINRTGEDTWSVSTCGYNHADQMLITEMFIKSGLFKYDFSKGSIEEFDKMSGRTFTRFKLRNIK